MLHKWFRWCRYRYIFTTVTVLSPFYICINFCTAPMV